MYQAMSDIAAALAAEITATERFKKVLVAQATDGGQLYDQLETMAATPCAIVVIGQIEYEEHGVSRTVRPMIFVVDKYRKGMTQTAAGIWDLTESILALFAPAAEVADIEWRPDNWTPIESPDGVSAAMVTLEGTEFL